MVPLKFTTASLPIREQFESWHSWYDSLLETVPLNPPDKGFLATSLIWRMGHLAVARVSAPAIRSLRTRALIRRNPIDHWIISVNQRGTFDIKTPETSLSLRAGVPVIIAMADEMETVKGDYARVQLYLARDGFQRIAALLDAVRTTALDGPEGALLADYMALLARNLPDLLPEDGPRLGQAVEAMLSACLGPTADRIAVASKQMDLTLLERVRRAVRAHLRAPSLSPDMLCREAAISRSQLYRLLESEGGVAHYILRQRLSESFTMLSDITNALPIGTIAELLCFADASSFSRAFRREFGMSPSEVRSASLAGLPPMVHPKDVRQEGIHDFSAFLRDF
jgi:AraC-like DNA-binding protein